MSGERVGEAVAEVERRRGEYLEHVGQQLRPTSERGDRPLVSSASAENGALGVTALRCSGLSEERSSSSDPDADVVDAGGRPTVVLCFAVVASLGFERTWNDRLDRLDDLVVELGRVALLQPVHVGEVLRSTDRDLVADEICPRDEGDRQTIEFDQHTPLPRVFEIDSVDRGQDVDAMRGVAKLNDRVRADEVAGFEPEITETERLEGVEDASCVGGVDPHPGVEITGRPW